MGCCLKDAPTMLLCWLHMRFCACCRGPLHLISGFMGCCCLNDATISAAPRLAPQLNAAAAVLSSSADVPAASRHSRSSASSRASALGDTDTALSLLTSSTRGSRSIMQQCSRLLATNLKTTSSRKMVQCCWEERFHMCIKLHATFALQLLILEPTLTQSLVPAEDTVAVLCFDSQHLYSFSHVGPLRRVT